MKKDIIVPVVSLLIICLVASALLGGVNMLTADRIDTLAAQTVIDAQQELLPAASYTEETIDGTSYFAAYDAENNLLLVKGSVPGPKKSLIMIKETVKKTK